MAPAWPVGDRHELSSSLPPDGAACGGLGSRVQVAHTYCTHHSRFGCSVVCLPWPQVSDPGHKLRHMTKQLSPACLPLLKLQSGVIASWQASSAGLGPRRMEALVHGGRWQRLQHGVYASFTGEPPRRAVLWAAVLRAGPQSILSHETAAELDGLLDKPSKLLHVAARVASLRGGPWSAGG